MNSELQTPNTMFSKKQICITTFLFGVVFGILIIPFVVLAADPYGLEATAVAANLKRSETVPQIIGNVIGSGLSLVGILFFILMVYGGFLWMLARGNEDQTKKALQTIVAAIIGIIIVFASYAITNFVLQSTEEGPLGSGGGSSGEDIGDTTVACGGTECTNQQVCAPDVADVSVNVCVDLCASITSGGREEHTCKARSTCSGEVLSNPCPGGSDWICCST